MDDLNDFNSLHGIRVRYFKRQIYTQVGQPILIAINPYQIIPELYSQDAINFYRNRMKFLQGTNKEQQQQKLRELEPHLYKVAQMAYDELFQEVDQTHNMNKSVKSLNQDQVRICSMIISGESGSGKTESTKRILKYIAQDQINVNMDLESSMQLKQQCSIESQVFASNPLLQAFGNAKTARNDNSSRFGKFIHIYFTHTKKIKSAKIDNYLLEKTRVVRVGSVERNYHIFYQLLGSSDKQLLQKLGLTSISAFNYLKDGDRNYSSENESADFDETMKCLSLMNFNQQEQDGIIQIVAAILHLGNIKFNGDENKSSIDQQDSSVKLACSLLGVDVIQFNDILCHKIIISGKEKITQDNGIAKAQQMRDGLAKNIYTKLFDWLVWRVNQVLAKNKGQSEENEEQPSNPARHMVGVLDIFGFEIFEDAKTKLHYNSFEQLCINFANESLQQHFNSNMLDSEQVEYKEEQIAWEHIIFPDNKDIIDLIANPNKGIFRLLNDEAIAPKGLDKGFLNKVSAMNNLCLITKENIDKNFKEDAKVNKKAHKQANFGWFCIKHFAGGVVYNVDGFVEKNKDQTNPEFVQVMQNSTNIVMNEISCDREEENQNKSKQDANVARNQQNVISFFKNQLESLMKILNQSIPYYIRCIKPNNNKSSQEFDAIEVMRQIRCAGLQQAIRIRKAGYEIRTKHEDFVKKYRFITKSSLIESHTNITADQLKNDATKMIKSLSDLPKFKAIMKKQSFYERSIKTSQIQKLRNFLDQKVIQFKMKFIIKIQKFIKVYVACRINKRIKQKVLGQLMIRTSLNFIKFKSFMKIKLIPKKLIKIVQQDQEQFNHYAKMDLVINTFNLKKDIDQQQQTSQKKVVQISPQEDISPSPRQGQQPSSDRCSQLRDDVFQLEVNIDQQKKTRVAEDQVNSKNQKQIQILEQDLSGKSENIQDSNQFQSMNKLVIFALLMIRQLFCVFSPRETYTGLNQINQLNSLLSNETQTKEYSQIIANLEQTIMTQKENEIKDIQKIQRQLEKARIRLIIKFVQQLERKKRIDVESDNFRLTLLNDHYKKKVEDQEFEILKRKKQESIDQMKNSKMQQNDLQTSKTTVQQNTDIMNQSIFLSMCFEQEESEQIDYVIQSMEAQIETRQLVIQQDECPTCFEIVDQSRILTCKHKIHYSCLIQTVNGQYNSEKRLISEFLCPISGCKSQIPSEMIRIIVGEDKYEKIMVITRAQKVDKSYSCPWENCETIIIGIKKEIGINDKQLLLCISCKQQICILCRQKYHGENLFYEFNIGKVHEGQQQYVDKTRQQCPMVINLIREGLGNEQTFLCPKCKVPALKDEQCDQVTCANCRQLYCFQCSVAQNPISVHGNHYHRDGCKNFQEWIDDRTGQKGVELYSDKCQECLKLKKVCERPVNLEQYKLQNPLWFEEQIQKEIVP